MRWRARSIGGAVTAPDVAEPVVDALGLPLISCAPKLIYGGGALPDELAGSGSAGEIIEPASYGMEPISSLFGSSHYRWRITPQTFVVDDVFSGMIAEFYGQRPYPEAPVSALVRMRDVTLIGGVLYAHAGGPTSIIYETCRHIDRDVVWMAPAEKIRAADRKMFSLQGWRSFYLGSAGSFNYGHWLVDDLPRLKGIFHMMTADPGPIRVVIESFGTEIDRVRIDSIRTLLAQQIHVDIVARHEAYHFSTLYYPTPISEHPVVKSPIALDFLARRALETVGLDQAAQGGGRRVFVDRSVAHGRSLINGDAVRSLMASHGFAIINPEGMSFAEQVRLFAGASIVVGQMGAAMTNTLFCRPTTTTLYLAPAGWIEPFYFDLAMTRGHEYQVLYGPVVNPEVPPHQSDFSVSIQALAAWLEAL